MKAEIVVGLQFGDEGKGITTDFLCSKHDPRDTTVVRYCGGHQAGHTVHYNGISHVFSSFGSGTLRGFPTFISEYCLVYPNALMTELEVLNSKGIEPVFHMHPFAKLVTPYDIKAGRTREEELQHGSTGWGIGATMKRNEQHFHKLFVVDMLHTRVLREKLLRIKEFYSNYLDYDFPEETDHQVELMLEYSEFLRQYIFDTPLCPENMIFEGAQGIMLDRDHGIFPNVTYAYTTSRNAIKLCKNLGIKRNEIDVYYVTRCYQTRHGNGWMSNNDPVKLINNQHETNIHNQWQKDFKVGEIDYELLNYAFRVDRRYSSSIKSHLVVTCLDQRPGYIVSKDFTRNFNKLYHSFSPDSKDFKGIR